MVTEARARERLLKILDDAHDFGELGAGLAAEHDGNGDALFGAARRFLAEGNAACLDAELKERFAQVLSRFVESRRALELAGILEAGEQT
jgi:hypothetical protein